MRRHLLLFILFGVSLTARAADLSTQALFQRLTGKPILKKDPRYGEIQKLLSEGKGSQAAQLITEDPSFYDTTIRHFAAPLSNRTEATSTPLNDFIALVVGVIRDGVDARLLLTGDFRYEAASDLKLTPMSPLNNKHFEEFEEKRLSLKQHLVKVSPQWTDLKSSAGLLTTRAWGAAHYLAGTNRRSTEFAFRQFLCQPIERWKTPGLSTFHIRRDVDRAPGMDPNRFETECRTCHAALDGMSGAFARFDFRGDKYLFQNGWVAPKYNQNSDVFKRGYETRDSSWVNLLSSDAHMEMFGWRTDLEGVGVNHFGTMLAESKAFSQCMVRRVFHKVCRRDLNGLEAQFLLKQSDSFEQGNYNLKRLFETIALSDECYET